MQSTQPKKKQSVRVFAKKFWKLNILYWKSDDKKWGLIYLAGSIAFSLALVFIQYHLTQWNQDFYGAIEKYDSAGFFSSIKKWLFLVTIFVTIAVTRFVLYQKLIIRWRKWMTEYALDKYLSHSQFYYWKFLKVPSDNPDQRISEDCRDFTDTVVSLGLDLFSQIIVLFTFSAMLWSQSKGMGIFGVVIPGYMFWASLVYSIIGTYLARLIGKRLAPLSYEQQKLEADFRYHLVRVRENSEAIAFLEGNKAESRNLKSKLGDVMENMVNYVRERKHLAIFTTGFGTLANIFPIIVAAPKYFAKEIALGQIFQISSAFGRVNDAMSFFVDGWSRMTAFFAVVDRLDEFFTAADEADHLPSSQNYMQPSDSHILKTEKLFLHFPQINNESGKPSLAFPDISLSPNESLLIQGPSGVGKSTFFRAMHRLWPFVSGKVEHSNGQTMIIPQMIYLPLGTFKDLITYPDPAEKFSDQEVSEAVRLVQLDKYLPLLGHFEAWHLRLSVGEQQRIAWARVFLKKPKWVLIDEGTSALDENLQQDLYQKLSQMKGTGFISIAHRPGLEKFHQKSLQIQQ